MSAAERALASAVSEVADFMRKRRLRLDDLINVGGEEILESTDTKRAEKARRVSSCWDLMARLGVKYRDIEHSEYAPQPIPALTA
jgi:hypothetical protein